MNRVVSLARCQIAIKNHKTISKFLKPLRYTLYYSQGQLFYHYHKQPKQKRGQLKLCQQRIGFNLYDTSLCKMQSSLKSKRANERGYSGSTYKFSVSFQRQSHRKLHKVGKKGISRELEFLELSFTLRTNGQAFLIQSGKLYKLQLVILNK
ncbi:hypothetical protein TTHERM_000974099 (macronuclear) [Tetrahymena thermophila SB210]|uniref:Uncharacterized protein n=1 Tax=Tetrahymena thermophila (strain SB210) TaxID=312017 RepID=W7XL99_TETTS|nr:hypothetical protein TTHERM_000974099 [Tetrahymena thermophila SB210]EWS75919.1 hypothetical protein TTHERM_000974099 [Tetrahymena thermophila SB210]|eukprot:XP_012651544.1 hypothetical protein TTHERM_000974099 [Tetrahymena thermophila SB210]